MSQLLEYLVEETLAGRADQLKGYAIGVDVFDKGEDFDPARDSIVRVQMARLRELLASYYEGEGNGDPVRIVLNKGNYVPVFQQVPKQGDGRALVRVAQPEESAVRPKGEDRLVRWLIVAGLAAILVLAGWAMFNPDETPEEVAAEQPDGPTVVVAAYAYSGNGSVAHRLRDGLQYDLITFLSQLPNIGVVGYATMAEKETVADASLEQVDFVLRGEISATDTQFRVVSNLVRTRDDMVIWSQSTPLLDLDPYSFLQQQNEIALAVASELGQPYGVIHEAMRDDLENHRGLTMDNYLCELRTYEYRRARGGEALGEARECLERAVAQTPNYSNAWALLSGIYGDDARLRLDGAQAEAASRRSLEAALEAVEANPTNALAYNQLAVAQFYLGETAAALDSIDRALRLGPNNCEILAKASWLLASIEGNELAPELGEKAIALNPGHPPWYWQGPAIAALASGDSEAALHHAELMAADGNPLSTLLLAAALELSGRHGNAERALDQLEGRAGPIEEELATWRLPDAVSRLVRSAAGPAGSG